MSHRHISTADHLLGSSTRARLLRILLFQRCPRAWLRDLSRRTSTGVEAVRRELDLLTSLGLVRMNREGGAAFFETVDDHPITEPLRQLIAYADDYDRPRPVAPRLALATERQGRHPRYHDARTDRAAY